MDTKKTTADDSPTAESTSSVEDASPSAIPNGGLIAWLQVAGSFCLYFCTWGKHPADITNRTREGLTMACSRSHSKFRKLSDNLRARPAFLPYALPNIHHRLSTDLFNGLFRLHCRSGI